MNHDAAYGHVKYLKTLWDDNGAARKRAKALTRLASGDWVKDVPKMPGEPDWHADQTYRPAFAPDLLGTALRHLDYLYDEDPARTISDPAAAEWAANKLHAFGLGLSLSMSQGDKLARLHGAALLLPVYKHGPDAARDIRAGLLGDLGAEVDRTNDGVEVVVVSRDNFELIPNELDPRHPEAGVVFIGMTRNSIGPVSSQPVHHYYDTKYFARLVNFEPQPIGPDGEEFVEHGYGDHPFILLRNDESGTTLYADGMGGEDVIDNVKAIGGLLREYGWSAKLQRGQPFVIGAEIKNAVLAPDAILQVPAGGQFGIQGGGANLEGMKDAVNTHLELLARTLGLAPTAFRLDHSVVGLSGIALAMERADLEDDRRARAKLGQYWERQVHRKAAMVYAGATGELFDVSDVQVKYAPLPLMLSFDQRMAQLTFEWNAGLLGRLDALRALHPGVNDEVLLARLERADADREAGLLAGRTGGQEEGGGQ